MARPRFAHAWRIRETLRKFITRAIADHGQLACQRQRLDARLFATPQLDDAALDLALRQRPDLRPMRTSDGDQLAKPTRMARREVQADRRAIGAADIGANLPDIQR